jgi:hypothetical protein
MTDTRIVTTTYRYKQPAATRAAETTDQQAMIHNEALREQFERKFSGEIFIYVAVGHELGIVAAVPGGRIHLIPAEIVCGERDEISKLARKLNQDRLRVPAWVVQDILSNQAAKARRRQRYQYYHADLRPIHPGV